MATIANGSNKPLNIGTGSVPQNGGTLLDWFQPMIFTKIVKIVDAFQAVEGATSVNFQGVIQPLSAQRLQLKPEGQRAWTWLMLHASPSLTLTVDEIVNYLGIQTRVMARKDYSIYGYIEYELVQDWGGSGPTPTDIPNVLFGGNAETSWFGDTYNGGGALSSQFVVDEDGGEATTTDYEYETNGGNNG